MTLINRIKTFLWVLLLAFISFIAIFVPPLFDSLNKGTRKMIKELYEGEGEE